MHTIKTVVWMRGKRKSLTFSLFYLCFVRSCQNNRVSLHKKPLNFIVMSLRDWLLAAGIYEELFDDGSDTTSHDNTRDYDSSYDYDDYEENF